MCEVRKIDEAYRAYRDELVAAGLLLPLGVRGLYGRSGTFEHIVDCFEGYVTRMGAHLQQETMRFPPLIAREVYERTGHINNFPDLMGSVDAFTGGPHEHQSLLERFNRGERWGEGLEPSELMLVPAACYPLYPLATGTLPAGGRRVDLKTFVFRHEPSDDPARMQLFRQREYVRLGTADEAMEHRDYWLRRGEEMLSSVGLDVQVVVANDPFFGRGAKVMKATQREQTLKFELVVPICSTEKPTAVSSANCHLDHFGVAFDIRAEDGRPAHSACIGFGLERITLALLRKHGFDLSRWPAEVRQILALG
jgi:seryl-tRNA synthetase